MNLHEYQAKQLMERHGVKVPAGEPATNLDEAKAAIVKLFNAGNARVVVKSQIHAGGRGKGTFKDGFQGGVHLADSLEDATAKAEAMLGNVLGNPTNRRSGQASQSIAHHFGGRN